MWGPLALAAIATMLRGIWRDLRGDQDMRMLKTWEWLQSWALPFMAEALKEETEESEARSEFEAFKRLAEQLKQKQGNPKPDPKSEI